MPERRIAFPGLVCLAALALALITVPPVQARATLDDGKPGPGARWDPGMVLVKLRPGITPSHRQRMLHRLGLRLVDRLPLVPDLYEVRVPPGTHVLAAERKLSRQPGVLYAQPNYDETETPDSGPSDRSYWPNDPGFWPSRFTPPQGCEEPDRTGQWPLWLLGHNLTDSRDPANKFNPLISGRADVDSGLVQYEQYHSINVLPVWNLLRDRDRLKDRGKTKWRTEDIRRSGIAVQDTGLSNAPDIAPQIAALFSTVTSTVPTKRDLVREVYRDDRDREDLKPVKAAFDTNFKEPKNKIEFDFKYTDRPLFALDDTNISSPRIGDDRGLLPDGCNGHGTAVAAVAAAKAGNATGIAGVAYDVPLIGLRAGAPWDSPGVEAPASDKDIETAWRQWWGPTAEYTTENKIEQLEIVKALQIPVLNMSYSRPLFEASGQADAPPVVSEPALAEAWLRTLATGKTLGVAAAGNGAQHYGSPGNPAGTAERAPRAPCGLKLLRNSNAVDTPNGKKFSDVAFPGPKGDGGSSWSDVNLLCVAASTSWGSRLADFSGSGDAAVDLAAPGQDITTLARPVVGRDGTAVSPYQVEKGTSFAAPMVAGAAALLREAAPGARIAQIARALRQGARRNPSLAGLVRYGSLDVACALSALGKLQKESEANWKLVSLKDPDFEKATEDCGGKPQYVEETIHKVSAESLGKQGPMTLSALIEAKRLSPQPTSGSRKWQERLLLGKPQARRVALSSAGTAVDPAEVKDRVYDAGGATVGCIDPGFQITDVRVTVLDQGAPQLWFFPADGQPRHNWIEVALALAAPLPKKLNSLTIRLRAYCDEFPSIPG